jgi:type 1 fimbria pilin
LTVTGGATKVELQLQNQDLSIIKVGTSAPAQVALVAGAAQLNYYVQYFAPTGGATAGPANSLVDYTIVYN